MGNVTLDLLSYKLQWQVRKILTFLYSFYTVYSLFNIISDHHGFIPLIFSQVKDCNVWPNTQFPTVQYKHGIIYESWVKQTGCQRIQNLMEILFIGIVCNEMQKSKYILFFNSAQLYAVSFFNSYSIIFCTCVVSFHILASAYIFERMIWAEVSSGSMSSKALLSIFYGERGWPKKLNDLS